MQPHAWVLSPRELRAAAEKLRAAHLTSAPPPLTSSLRISPWKGFRGEKEFSTEDTRPSDPDLHATAASRKADAQARTNQELFAERAAAPSWVLPFSDPRLHDPAALVLPRACRVPLPPISDPKSFWRRFLELCVSLGLGAGSLWFYWEHLETIPVVGRTHFVALSPDWEAWIGAQMFEGMLGQEGLVQISDPTDKRLQLVQAVGARLAAASGRADWNWQFVLVESPLVNAACYPGGKVVVYTGLLDLIARREEAYRSRVEALGLPHVAHLEEAVESELAAEGALGRFLPGWLSLSKQNPPPPTAGTGAASSEVGSNPRPVALQHVHPHVWPWEEHSLHHDEKDRTIVERIAGWFSQSPKDSTDAEKAAPPSSAAVASGVAAAWQPHSHDLDAAGLKINRGLMANQLAVVLGHEVAHALARHSAEQLSWLLPLMVLGQVNASSPLLAWAFEHFWNLPYSRRAELEADHLGLVLMARACFHPGSAAGFWRDFDSTSEFAHYFSTHPADARRARASQERYPEARDEMKRCCK